MQVGRLDGGRDRLAAHAPGLEIQDRQDAGRRIGAVGELAAVERPIVVARIFVARRLDVGADQDIPERDLGRRQLGREAPFLPRAGKLFLGDVQGRQHPVVVLDEQQARGTAAGARAPVGHVHRQVEKRLGAFSLLPPALLDGENADGQVGIAGRVQLLLIDGQRGLVVADPAFLERRRGLDGVGRFPAVGKGVVDAVDPAAARGGKGIGGIGGLDHRPVLFHDQVQVGAGGHLRGAGVFQRGLQLDRVHGDFDLQVAEQGADQGGAHVGDRDVGAGAHNDGRLGGCFARDFFCTARLVREARTKRMSSRQGNFFFTLSASSPWT